MKKQRRTLRTVESISPAKAVTADKTGKTGRADKQVQHASVEEVASFAAGLPEEFLECREMGHNWLPHTAHWLPEYQVYERSLRCPRCTTERHQTLSDRGHVLSGGYHYPEGYSHNGYGRITGDGRDRLRLESMIRQVGSPGSTGSDGEVS